MLLLLHNEVVYELKLEALFIGLCVWVCACVRVCEKKRYTYVGMPIYLRGYTYTFVCMNRVTRINENVTNINKT